MASWDDYLSSLPPEVAEQVMQFYQGNPGYGQYTGQYGQSSNPYANINVSAYDHLNAKRNPGDKLYADLVRAQTQDYLQRFAPIENMLAASITPTGTTYIDQDLANTRSAFTGATENVRGQIGRQNQRFGLVNELPQGFENQAVGALVGGINDTYTRDQDRRQALLVGGLGPVAQNVRQTAV
jgi:hypothetical protein